MIHLQLPICSKTAEDWQSLTNTMHAIRCANVGVCHRALLQYSLLTLPICCKTDQYLQSLTSQQCMPQELSKFGACKQRLLLLAFGPKAQQQGCIDYSEAFHSLVKSKNVLWQQEQTAVLLDCPAVCLSTHELNRKYIPTSQVSLADPRLDH